MSDFPKLRQLLHQMPELAGQEQNTSETIHSFLENLSPDKIISGLGGFGVAAIYTGEKDGPKVLIRCELDALPIAESLDVPYRSTIKGVSHKCGHDGHMAIVAGLAAQFYKQRPKRGSVTLLFQPSEETGEGAQRVLDDEQFGQIEPDYAVAIHNLPGFPTGQVILSDGIFASASSGLKILLKGQTSHAAQPSAGKSPALAISQLITGLSTIPQFHTALHEPAQVTVVHATLGEVAFGTSPGTGVVMATLRAHSQEVIDLLADRAVAMGEQTAKAFGLVASSEFVQPFPSTINDGMVSSVVEKCARECDLEVHRPETPFAWSEDFGHFTSRYRGALVGLGAGENCPPLHHPDYNFPDEIIVPGINLLKSVTRQLLELEDV